MSMLLMVKALEIETNNAARKLVLIKLADNANDSGVCWPSLSTIARVCSISRRSVINHINALEEAGLLKVTHRKGEKGNATNMYQLCLGGENSAPATNSEKPVHGANNSLGGETVALPPSETVAPRTSQSSEPVIEPNKNTKAQMLESRFESFYSKYPIKKSKARALKVFTKLNPDDLLLQKIIRALRSQIENRNNALAAGVWVPDWKHPSTWLNDQCWEDSLIEIPAYPAGQPHMGGRNHGTAAAHRQFTTPRQKLSTVDRQHAAADAYLAGLQGEQRGENLDDSVVASYE